MVFKLGAVAGLDRVVAGVVRPRRNLVGEQRVADPEEFDAADPDVVERFEQRADTRLGPFLERGVEAGGGRTGHPEDAVAVLVRHEGPRANLAVAAAHGDQRREADLIAVLCLQ